MLTDYDALMNSYREYVHHSEAVKLRAGNLFRERFPDHTLLGVNLFVSSEPAAVEFKFQGEPMGEDRQLAFATEVKDRLGGFSSWFIDESSDAG